MDFFVQYEPGVLEVCLQLLELSLQHLSDTTTDDHQRADPVYLCRVLCAMMNCNDDLGVFAGKWQGSYKDGVSPTEWTGSAEILHQWMTSNCSPVRHGESWVFACVLCTVLRVLGIPSRVVTVFNAARDVNANLIIEEYYSSRGEKFSLSEDSIWNFHVWVECWMRREDLGAEFDGWQVVDPTPQKKSAGVFCCGPCPVTAVQRRCLHCPFDAAFILASVDADVVRLIVRDGLVVGRSVDTEWVGQLIYTKSIGSDNPENLSHTYKVKKPSSPATLGRILDSTSPVKVSLDVEKPPSVGDPICLRVTITNHSSHPRFLMEHLNAQLKRYNSCPHKNFWRTFCELEIPPMQVLAYHYTIPASQYKPLLALDDIVNVAVVINDIRSKKHVLAAQEFIIGSDPITITVVGGDSIQMNNKYTAHVSYKNQSKSVLRDAVLCVEGYRLLQNKHETRLALLQPGETIQISVSIMASSLGTKLLQGTFSHSHSPGIVAQNFHKISVYK